MRLSVKNVRESSWERFKQELERVTGSHHPGLGKALSDAMDYYVEHVLSNRSTKEWGGGVKKKVFKKEDKIKQLTTYLAKDLERERPKLWNPTLVYSDLHGDDWVVYKISERALRKAIVENLGVSDRHTIRSYIDYLEAKGFIRWDSSISSWVLSNEYWLDGDELPVLSRTLVIRRKMEGTIEYELYKKMWQEREEDKRKVEEATVESEIEDELTKEEEAILHGNINP